MKSILKVKMTVIDENTIIEGLVGNTLYIPDGSDTIEHFDYTKPPSFDDIFHPIDDDFKFHHRRFFNFITKKKVALFTLVETFSMDNHDDYDFDDKIPGIKEMYELSNIKFNNYGIYEEYFNILIKEKIINDYFGEDYSYIQSFKVNPIINI